MNNPMQMINQIQQLINSGKISQIRQNPMQFFASMGLNVPQNIVNDPNAIIQHLMNNGSISQEQYNQAINMAKQLGYKG